MTNPQQHDSSPPTVYNDVVDLSLLVRSLWWGRGWVIRMILAGTLIGFGISLLSTTYQSRGLFLTPGFSANNYKAYFSALNNPPDWQLFRELTGQQDSAAAKLISKIITSPDPRDFRKMVSPVFRFTDTEAKQFGIKFDEFSTDLVGLNLELEQNKAARPAPIQLLADYVRSTLIRVDLRESLRNACVSNRNTELTLTNQKLENAFSIVQDQQRHDTLEAILARLPDSAKINNQQVIAMQPGSEHFLSPVMQLVGVEVTISEKKLADAKYDRDLTAAHLKVNYYCKASDAANEAGTGQVLLARLADIYKQTFQDTDMGMDVVRQTANELQIQLDNWNNYYLSQMRFVAPTEGAEVRVRKLGLSLGLLLGAMLGGLFGTLLALFRTWWRDNRDIIVSKS